ncbi:hypothetical protein EK904_010045, partial [Melospiza melodia maxima]
MYAASVDSEENLSWEGTLEVILSSLSTGIMLQFAVVGNEISPECHPSWLKGSSSLSFFWYVTCNRTALCQLSGDWKGVNRRKQPQEGWTSVTAGCINSIKGQKRNFNAEDDDGTSSALAGASGEGTEDSPSQELTGLTVGSFGSITSKVTSPFTGNSEWADITDIYFPSDLGPIRAPVFRYFVKNNLPENSDGGKFGRKRCVQEKERRTTIHCRYYRQDPNNNTQNDDIDSSASGIIAESKEGLHSFSSSNAEIQLQLKHSPSQIELHGPASPWKLYDGNKHEIELEWMGWEMVPELEYQGQNTTGLL